MTGGTEVADMAARGLLATSGFAEQIGEPVARQHAVAQRAVASAEAPPEAPSAAPATASGPTPAAAPPAATSPGLPTGDRELEELAQGLYERIRSRLRYELLVDRERAGMLSDLG